MRKRRPFEGMGRIVRFNWPLYAAALIVLLITLPAGVLAGSLLWRTVAFAAAAGAAWFLVGSLTAAHFTYDRSDLHRGTWLARAVPSSPRRIAVCHCGYDEISTLLREKLPGASLQIIDHYEEESMSEPSIHRARRLYPPSAGTLSAPHGTWSANDGAFDAIFGVLAIHELRTHAARAAWFAEARRCLADGGRVIVVEHLRDSANFAAFGPGFMHFHSAATWRRAWQSTGLRCQDDFRINPFVRVFVLSRHD